MKINSSIMRPPAGTRTLRPVGRIDVEIPA
jgi:hypothetical protein